LKCFAHLKNQVQVLPSADRGFGFGTERHQGGATHKMSAFQKPVVPSAGATGHG
jgi:hypothetical protein